MKSILVKDRTAQLNLSTWFDNYVAKYKGIDRTFKIEGYEVNIKFLNKEKSESNVEISITTRKINYVCYTFKRFDGTLTIKYQTLGRDNSFQELYDLDKSSFYTIINEITKKIDSITEEAEEINIDNIYKSLKREFWG